MIFSRGTADRDARLHRHDSLSDPLVVERSRERTGRGRGDVSLGARVAAWTPEDAADARRSAAMKQLRAGRHECDRDLPSALRLRARARSRIAGGRWRARAKPLSAVTERQQARMASHHPVDPTLVWIPIGFVRRLPRAARSRRDQDAPLAARARQQAYQEAKASRTEPREVRRAIGPRAQWKHLGRARSHRPRSCRRRYHSASIAASNEVTTMRRRSRARTRLTRHAPDECDGRRDRDRHDRDHAGRDARHTMTTSSRVLARNDARAGSPPTTMCACAMPRRDAATSTQSS